MCERLRELRKVLKLSQDSFGEKIGISGGGISLLEKGKRNFTEQNIKAICREFGVDYIWLTTGEGEMFVNSDDDYTERIDRVMAGENEVRKNMIKALVDASDDDIEALDNLVNYYLLAKKEKD